MAWEPNFESDWQGKEVESYHLSLPRRAELVSLPAFEFYDEVGMPTGESQPERIVQILAIDREYDVWIARDTLTRETLFLQFDAAGRFCYVRIDKQSDPEDDGWK